jgi:uncharacterized membrane protein YGL010W
MAKRTLESWLAAYGESHQNPLNERLHRICVPLITFSLLGMCWALSPLLAFALCALGLLFYLRLSLPLAAGMSSAAALSLWLASLLEHPFEVSLVVFALAWVGQFYGHHVEGRRPSFFQDLQFLLVGPIWLLSGLYRRLGLPL